MNHLKKLNLIQKTSFVIPVMVVFSSLWSLMLIKLVTKTDLFSAKNLLAVLLTLNLLWILRLIDEIKDFEYDKIAHPERALPSGLVSRKDIVFYIIIFSILGIIGTLFFNSVLMVLYPLTILYGIFLIKLEEVSSVLKDNFIINLIITYPVNTLINLSIISFYCASFTELLKDAHFILIPFFAFLHYEFGRKTKRVSAETKGEELYSEQIGFPFSLTLSTLTAVLAVIAYSLITSFTVYSYLFLTWPLIFAALFALRLIKSKLYKISAMIFILGFYLFVIIA